MDESDFEDPDLFIDYARYDWLVTLRNRVLHFVPENRWTAAHRQDMALNWMVTTPVRLACGQLARQVMIPGMFSRSALPRCRECCRATGIPYGKGSPKNDDALRKRLGLDDCSTAEGTPRRRRYAHPSRR